MSSRNVQQTERSYMAELLKKDPNYYADQKKKVEYDFRDLGGRAFEAREPYQES